MDADEAHRPTAVPWPPILFTGALVAAVLLGRFYRLPWPGLDDRPARMVGYAFGVVGIALMIWGLATLYQAKTNVWPHKGADRLITHGPFRFRRNPIYMGEILILLGLAQATLNIWFAIMAPVFALAILGLAILPEERHLEARFGEDYLDYKARTRRWF
jgi:protein-S-isoprenylcysteine O-methyltransferase Ste14